MERDELLLAITRCPEVGKARGSAYHPCRRVVCWQDPDDYHVPEPWQGQIETARILFISLNPGYGGNQVFPTPSWSDETTIDFFERRFDDAAGWTRCRPDNLIDLRLKDANGNEFFPRNPVSHWRHINTYATELLGRAPIFGQDIAMTQAVHCKSEGGEVAKPAMRVCTTKWLDLVVEQSVASVFVLLGKDAQYACARMWGFDKNRRVHFGVNVPGGERAVVLLPHPAARNKQAFGSYINREELQRLRTLLSGPD